MKYFMCCIRRIKHLLLLYSSCSYMTSLNFSLPPSFLSSFYVNLIFCSSFLLSPPFILLSARLSPRPRAHTVSGRMSIKSCSVNLFMGESGPAQIRTQCLVPVVIAPAPSHPAQWMTIRLPPSKAVQIIIPHSITSSLVNKLHIQESYTHLFSASSLFFSSFSSSLFILTLSAGHGVEALDSVPDVVWCIWGSASACLWLERPPHRPAAPHFSLGNVSFYFHLHFRY